VVPERSCRGRFSRYVLGRSEERDWHCEAKIAAGGKELPAAARRGAPQATNVVEEHQPRAQHFSDLWSELPQLIYAKLLFDRGYLVNALFEALVTEDFFLVFFHAVPKLLDLFGFENCAQRREKHGVLA